MKLIKCPKCGEMYSDSYKTCPFCQEDEALKGRSAAPHRKVTKHRRAPSILGPAMVLVVVLAAVLVGVLLFGGKGSANKPADKPPVEEPTPTPTEPLTLDQTTLNMNQGETATLTVTGAENVLWTSSDPNVATVDDSGTPQKLSCRNPDSPNTLNSLHDDSRVFLPGQLPFQSLHVIQIDKCHLMSPVPRCLYCRVIRDGNGPARTPVKGSVHGQYFRTPRNKRRQFQGILVSLSPTVAKEQIIIRATGKLP